MQDSHASPAKRFNESISQNQREGSLSQIVSSIYDHSGNVPDDAIQDENRNPYVHDPGAQTLGIQKVCYAVRDIRSIGEQSGRTTGRLGSTGLQAMPLEGRHSWNSGAHLHSWQLALLSSSTAAIIAGPCHSQ